MANVPVDTASLAERNHLGASLHRQYATNTGMGLGGFIAFAIVCVGLIVVLLSHPLELLFLLPIIALVLFGQYWSSTEYEQVDVYEHGFVVVLKGKGSEVIRWQDIDRVSVYNVYRSRHEVCISHNGKQLILHGMISRFDELCKLLQDYSPMSSSTRT